MNSLSLSSLSATKAMALFSPPTTTTSITQGRCTLFPGEIFLTFRLGTPHPCFRCRKFTTPHHPPPSNHEATKTRMEVKHQGVIPFGHVITPIGITMAEAFHPNLANALATSSPLKSELGNQVQFAEGLLMLTLAEIDPATAKLGITILGPLLSSFGFLFILRIVMSWYPRLPVDEFPFVIAYAPTEPILKQTRKLIPPVGGVDVTPVVWFGLISFLNEILVGPQGLLVLLSQQL